MCWISFSENSLSAMWNVQTLSALIDVLLYYILVFEHMTSTNDNTRKTIVIAIFEITYCKF